MQLKKAIRDRIASNSRDKLNWIQKCCHCHRDPIGPNQYPYVQKTILAVALNLTELMTV